MQTSLCQLTLLVTLLLQPALALAGIPIPIPLLGEWGLGGIAMVLGIVAYLASRRDK